MAEEAFSITVRLLADSCVGITCSTERRRGETLVQLAWW